MLYVMSQPLQAFAVTLCPISLIAPLGCAFTILFAAISGVMLGETYSKSDRVAICLAFLGSVGSVIFGPKINNFGETLEESVRVLTFWRHDGLDILIPVFLATAAISVIVVYWGTPRQAALFHPIMAAVFVCMSQSIVKILGLFVEQGTRIIGLHLFQFAMTSFALVLIGTLSITSVTLGAEKYDNGIFLPAYTCLQAFCLQVWGIMAFMEFNVLGPVRVGCFFFCSVLSFGAVILGSFHVDNEDDRKPRNTRTPLLADSDLETAASSGPPRSGGS